MVPEKGQFRPEPQFRPIPKESSEDIQEQITPSDEELLVQNILKTLKESREESALQYIDDLLEKLDQGQKLAIQDIDKLKKKSPDDFEKHQNLAIERATYNKKAQEDQDLTRKADYLEKAEEIKMQQEKIPVGERIADYQRLGKKIELLKNIKKQLLGQPLKFKLGDIIKVQRSNGKIENGWRIINIDEKYKTATVMGKINEQGLMGEKEVSLKELSFINTIFVEKKEEKQEKQPNLAKKSEAKEDSKNTDVFKKELSQIQEKIRMIANKHDVEAKTLKAALRHTGKDTEEYKRNLAKYLNNYPTTYNLIIRLLEIQE